jgi:hypothetical protein
MASDMTRLAATSWLRQSRQNLSPRRRPRRSGRYLLRRAHPAERAAADIRLCGSALAITYASSRGAVRPGGNPRSVQRQGRPNLTADLPRARAHQPPPTTLAATHTAEPYALHAAEASVHVGRGRCIIYGLTACLPGCSRDCQRPGVLDNCTPTTVLY